MVIGNVTPCSCELRRSAQCSLSCYFVMLGLSPYTSKTRKLILRIGVRKQ